MPLSTSSVQSWLDNIVEIGDFPPSPPSTHASETSTDQDYARIQLRNGTVKQALKRRRRVAMEGGWDEEETPRPNKKRNIRGSANTLVNLDTINSPTNAYRPFSDDIPQAISGSDASEATDIESHQSGRSSPTKQILFMQDLDEPIFFRGFHSAGLPPPADVVDLWGKIYELANGVGIMPATFEIPPEQEPYIDDLDRRHLSYPWAKAERRSQYGRVPPLSMLKTIVKAALCLEVENGHEDSWNSDVHLALLKIALSTSERDSSLRLSSVKTSRIDPPSLGIAKLPRRIVDYCIMLEKEGYESAFDSLRPHPGATLKSWNHITTGTCRKNPIAISIETKAPDKSWTDGLPQLGIWTRALMRRLDQIKKDFASASGAPSTAQAMPLVPPAMPVIIVQGHEWHVVIVSTALKYASTSDTTLKFPHKITTTVWKQIAIGSTRDVYSICKVLAVLHLLMDWAETKWRPWFNTLIEKDEAA